MRTAIRAIRRVLDGVLILLVGAVLALVLISNVGPSLGHRLVVIRGGSMEPALALGSVVDLTSVKPADIRAGDIVAIAESNGTVVTHRVTRVASLPDGLYIETKGDANNTPDPTLRPVDTVMGRVGFRAPALGYLIYMLSIPSGVLSVFSLGLTLLFAIWLLEDLEQDDDDGADEDAAPAREKSIWSTNELIG
jgi:signal peptidase